MFQYIKTFIFVILPSLILIVAGLYFFYFDVHSSENLDLNFEKVSFEQKITKALQSKDSLILSESDLNNILKEKISNSPELGEFEITGFNLKIKNKKLDVEMNVKKQNVTVLMKGEGDVSCEAGEIYIVANNFSIGSIPLGNQNNSVFKIKIGDVPDGIEVKNINLNSEEAKIDIESVQNTQK